MNGLAYVFYSWTAHLCLIVLNEHHEVSELVCSVSRMVNVAATTCTRGVLGTRVNPK